MNSWLKQDRDSLAMDAANPTDGPHSQIIEVELKGLLLEVGSLPRWRVWKIHRQDWQR